MDGKNVFKNASERMPEAVMTALRQNGLTIADVDLLIPHQANDRISQMVARKLQIPLEKVARNIDRSGIPRPPPSPSPWTKRSDDRRR